MSLVVAPVELDETVWAETLECGMDDHDCTVKVTHACVTTCGSVVLLCDTAAAIDRARIARRAWNPCGDCGTALAICWKVVKV